MRSYSPQWVWRCQSRGYRQLCSLWFEYDPCLNRKPPNDFKSCLTTLIRIRSTSVPKGGWAMIQIWSKKNSPMSSALCQSNGYRQLCSLWFEYDPCLNRKPPSDFKNCLTTLIRIRFTSVPEGGWTMIQIWSKKNTPMSSALCQSNGYRQLCSLWFEYDLCLNRKPPSDLIVYG